MQRLVIGTLGALIVLLGVVGVFSPFPLGIILIPIGFAMLARTSPWAARMHAAFARRFPKAAATAARVEERARAWWGRIRRRASPPR